MRRWLLASIVMLTASLSARADVKLNPLFTDFMVLQQGIACPVWGTATPNEAIEVKLEPVKAGEGESAAVKGTADDKGNWIIKLPKLKASLNSYTLSIQGKNTVALKDVLIGEVWICSGQSNMEMTLNGCSNAQEAIAKSANPMLRLFTVQKATSIEPKTEVVGKWAPSNPQTSPSFSGVGYYFGRDLQAALKVPVGLIHTSWGGTPAQAWTSQEALATKSELKGYVLDIPTLKKQYRMAAENYLTNLEKYTAVAKEQLATTGQLPQPPVPPQQPGSGQPSTLYNAMIAPLVPYGIAGAIWYQGESNAGAAYQYRTLFNTMIEDWRKQWAQGDFPFLCVQLAPFMKIQKEPMESQWAELRESQWLATKRLKNVGMAVITDAGDETDIHPKKKEPAGVRLALAARAIGYGEKIEFAGPEYKSVKFENGKAILSFDHTEGGLDPRGGELIGFTIAGKDKKFYNATAEIKDDTIIVTAPEVKEPAAVRYGWANFPVVNLWNKAGLPATPFRTDMPE